MFPHQKRVILAAGLVLSGLLTDRAATQQPAPPDGLIRSELSVMGRTATVAFSPSLNTEGLNDAAQVVRLTTNGSLRIGSLSLGKDDLANFTSYELRLRSTSDSWQLEVTAGQGGAGASQPAVVGQIDLARLTSAVASPTFVAALVPATENAGELLIRSGKSEAKTTVEFTDRPRRRLTEQSRPNQTTSRTHDEDTSRLSRARLLAQRNETALVLPKGQRLSVSFARAFTKQERSAAAAAANPGLGVDGPDFARLASTPNGSVVLLTESAVPRLRIESPLRFGQTNVATGNLGPGFPGAYGIWLKRAGNGWRLVLNHEPDAWGSQHDPTFDAAEIPLNHTEGQPASRPFAVALVPAAANRGRLVILWGSHEWTADFVVAN